MKTILKEIHQQPDHIREIFMWMCVVITVSGIGFFWLRSTQQRVTALLNPDQALQQAQADKTAVASATTDLSKAKSPFEMLAQSFVDLKANISDFVIAKGSAPQGIQSNSAPAVAPQALPVSADK